MGLAVHSIVDRMGLADGSPTSPSLLAKVKSG
jgi:hypothetical protein